MIAQHVHDHEGWVWPITDTQCHLSLTKVRTRLPLVPRSSRFRRLVAKSALPAAAAVAAAAPAAVAVAVVAAAAVAASAAAAGCQPHCLWPPLVMMHPAAKQGVANSLVLKYDRQQTRRYLAVTRRA